MVIGDPARQVIEMLSGEHEGGQATAWVATSLQFGS